MMDMATMKDCIETVGIETRSYSGRGMYGKSCLAFTVDDDLLGAVASIVAEAAERDLATEAVNAFSRASMDGMGMGTVVYFPSLKCEETGCEDEDE